MDTSSRLSISCAGALLVTFFIGGFFYLPIWGVLMLFVISNVLLYIVVYVVFMSHGAAGVQVNPR